jgi:DNA-binding CsgD family transcriptional regulator
VRKPPAEGKRLSPNERQVFIFLGQGKSTAEIAKLRGVNIKTIDSNFVRMKRKLGVKSLREMARMAVLATKSEITKTAAAVLDQTERIELRCFATGENSFRNAVTGLSEP